MSLAWLPLFVWGLVQLVQLVHQISGKGWAKLRLRNASLSAAILKLYAHPNKRSVCAAI